MPQGERGGLRPVTVLLVAAVLAVGLGTTWALAAAADRGQQQRRAELMDQRAQLVGNAVTAQVRRYTDTISDLAIAVGAQTTLTQSDYTALTSRMNRQQLPGATGAALVVPASDAQMAGLQKKWRRLGNRTLVLHPAGRQHEHLFSVLNYSLVGTSPNGLDASAADEPAEAMLLARNHGELTASRTYVLLRDRDMPPQRRQLSFVLVAPVYAGVGTPHAGRFEGWVVMALRGGDFIAQTMRDVSQDMLAVSLYDTSTVGKVDIAVAREPGALTDPRLRREVTVAVGDRHWKLVVQPTARTFDTMGPSPGKTLTSVGIVLTLLLAALVATLSRSRDRALRRVESATAALRADLTRRETVEATLLESEAGLEAFSGVVAHDLKSPLTSIAGYADILQEQDGHLLGEMGARCLDKIISSSARMRLLIDDLLNYAAARGTRLECRPVQLADLVADVVSERVGSLDERPAIEIGALPMIVADPTLLRQVLDNLIGNALKYVRPGDVPFVQIGSAPTAAGWRIEVSDRGIGIADADKGFVFDSFSRVRGSEGYTGTGLGLAICRRIVVERHGGLIGVEDNASGGSRFWFVLPYAGPEPADSAGSVDSAGSADSVVPAEPVPAPATIRPPGRHRGLDQAANGPTPN